MSELVRKFLDNAWFGDKVASWEGRRAGSVLLFEVIGNPQSFREIVNSPGDPEIVELYDPKPGQTLSFTFVDTEDNPLDMDVVVLDMNNPRTELQKGARFIMDASSTTVPGELAYTCHCVGIQEL